MRHALDQTDQQLLADCEVHTYRARGPGGQKRNKTDSAVRLHHKPTGLVVVGTESRSQHENRARALRRLRHAIALTCRQPIDLAAYTPPDCLKDALHADPRLRANRKAPQYPRVIAAVLDVLEAAQARTAETAQALGLSTAHLVHFLQADKKLWTHVNRLRRDHGLPPLR